MIHTERIIERSISIWSEWPGRRIASTEAFSLRDVADAEEVRIELAAARRPYFISWQQEDGASDDTHFHWLSVQYVSHFECASVEALALPPVMAMLRGSVVERVELYGRRDLDAVVAAIVIGHGCGVGIATARELPDKGRFSRFGGAELVVVDGDRLRSELARQGMERIVELRGRTA